jgi:hypothetical protein
MHISLLVLARVIDRLEPGNAIALRLIPNKSGKTVNLKDLDNLSWEMPEFLPKEMLKKINNGKNYQ